MKMASFANPRITKRRKIRELEAKRDKLKETIDKARMSLKTTAAELKAHRAKR
jgi:hypothetical protein